MLRKTIYTIILLAVYLTESVLAAAEESDYQYLKEPAVKWSNSRLTGEVKDAPVKYLITEILQRGGSYWEGIGELNGTIRIFFNHLTVNDSIKKIMRLNGFNYALIFEEHQSHDSGNSPPIKELIIYQGDEKIRFTRTDRRIPPPAKQIVKKTSEPATDKPAGRPEMHDPQSETPSQEDLALIDRELKTLADEMLAEKKISVEEYKELVEVLEDQP